MYNTFENDVVEIMNKHAPFKQTYRKPVQLPYMNKELRKAIYTKKMSYNKYTETKNSKSWEQYRKNSNLVNKLKRKSMKLFFRKGVLVAVNLKISGKQ